MIMLSSTSESKQILSYLSICLLIVWHSQALLVIKLIASMTLCGQF